MVGIALVSLAVLAGYASWRANITMLATAANSLGYVKRLSRIMAHSIDAQSGVQWLAVTDNDGKAIAHAGSVDLSTAIETIFDTATTDSSSFSVLSELPVEG